jgi:glutaredoxin-related protein
MRACVGLVCCLLLLVSLECCASEMGAVSSCSLTRGPNLRKGNSHLVLRYNRQGQILCPIRGGDGLSPELTARLEAIVKQSHVMLFMKGTPSRPECGFSSKIVQILKDHDITYGSFNSESLSPLSTWLPHIKMFGSFENFSSGLTVRTLASVFDDEEVRQGLKVYSNWPTFPQLYADGRLVGGLDVVKELVEEGQLKKELGVDKVEAAGDKQGEPTLMMLVERKITKALRADKVVIEDLSDGCGAKLNVMVVSSMFEGLRE